MAYMNTALDLYARTPTLRTPVIESVLSKQQLDELLDGIALAHLIQADRESEALMFIKPPSKLMLNPKNRRHFDEASAQLSEWRHRKRRRIDQIKQQYDHVCDMRSQHFTIAASARIGQLFLALASDMYNMEIPKTPPTPAEWKSYDCPDKEWAQVFRLALCDHMTDSAEPIELLAKQHFAVCHRKAVESGEVSEWSTLCEQELHQLSPEEYPIPSEIVADPKPGITLDVAPVR